MARDAGTRPSLLLWPADADRDAWRDLLFDAVCRLQFERDLNYTLEHDFKGQPMGSLEAATLASQTQLV